PPNSMEVRSTLSAAALSKVLPTGVEPVKGTLRRRGSAMTGLEVADAERPQTRLRRPAGNPAASMVWAKYCVVNGGSLAASRAMVQPAAIAGATLRVAIASGKFHGVINRQGPTGLRRVIMFRVPSGAGKERP